MIQTIIFYATLTALLSFFIDYCIGRPSTDFSPHEIFSKWTLKLAENRLRSIGLWASFDRQLRDAFSQTMTQEDYNSLRISFKKMLVQQAMPFFTWERACGMCPVCTNVWINVLFIVVQIFVLHLGILPSLYIILLSNFLIRLMIKL